MFKHHKKRTQEDYEREIIEAAEHMRKYPEHLKAARSNKTWIKFLVDIGIYERILANKPGQDFWESVRKEIHPQLSRTEKYQRARQAGAPTKIARKVRDWSEKRFFDFIENWEAKN